VDDIIAFLESQGYQFELKPLHAEWAIYLNRAGRVVSHIAFGICESDRLLIIKKASTSNPDNHRNGFATAVALFAKRSYPGYQMKVAEIYIDEAGRRYCDKLRRLGIIDVE
jgi:hypothetical protein